MLKLYGFSKVNAVARGNTRDLRVLWGLEEMQLPFELADRDFVATKNFSIADILMAHVLSSVIKDEGLIAPYPGVASYRDRCLARPAWKRTLSVYCARVEAG